MAQRTGNFGFLHGCDERLGRLATLAERYAFDDPAAALIKLRQFGEFLAKDVAARHALLPDTAQSFDDVLRIMRVRSILPREAGEWLFHLKRVGNAAAHEDAGTASDALTALKVARAAALWFARSYCGLKDLKAGPFVPPLPLPDSTAELRAEVKALQAAVRASDDAVAKSQLAEQTAAEARRDAESHAQERAFWESYAAETEAKANAALAELAAQQATAIAKPLQQLDLLAQVASRTVQTIELDEATTRVLIDDQLQAAGWIVDSARLRHGRGTKPEYGKAMAIAEWPTRSGPVDYALFIDGRCVGVVEAKREVKDVPGRLGQAKRYARDVTLAIDELPTDGPWQERDTDRFAVPFLFVTNGRPYAKQLETKSGIWFWDARTPAKAPRALPEWFSPRDLTERLQQVTTEPADAVAEREIGVSGLRPYQLEAIAAVELAIAAGQQHILLAMATGTGKTRLAIALMYEVLRRKRFRRILFLVDRNALGRQTLDAMSTTDTSGFLKFDEVFSVADTARKFPEATDRVQASGALRLLVSSAALLNPIAR